MKHLLICLLVTLGFQAFSQSETETIGKIIYYEGKVELGKDPTWTRAKINTEVKRNMFIKTGAETMAEITWNNGTKSVVGPNSKIEIKALFAGANGSGKTSTEGVFNEFKSVFKASPAAKRSEEGGVRREEVKKNKRDEIYWKQDAPITFQEAFAFYEKKEYTKAISALHSFIHQKPNDENVKFAEFALGHCYIMSNNTVKAREIFTQFIVKYPNDTLKAEAEKVLTLI
jgi:TolA-binding protein